MNNLCIFLNTRVENSGALTWIGDKGLAPFRYLFNGKTIRIQSQKSDQNIIEIHHVASFHKRGNWNPSRTNRDLTSSQTGMIKTALSVVLLIPGLLMGVFFKGMAYVFSDVREKHSLAKEHFTPVNREIGSVSEPITTRIELEKLLKLERKSDPKNRPTHALIIHGDGNLTINEDPGIHYELNPMKLVLEGASLVKESNVGNRLIDILTHSRKWKEAKADTVADALQATASMRRWTSCKRYHQLFQFARPHEA